MGIYKGEINISGQIVLESGGLMLRHISYRLCSQLASIPTKQSIQHMAVPIKGVIFDLDGTLTIPILNFTELRKRMGCPPPPLDILEFIKQQPDKHQEELHKIVEDFEDEGNRNMKLQPGVHEMLRFLSGYGLQRAIVTRNAQPCVDGLLSVLGETSSYGGPFTHMLTRDFTPTKPDPAPIQYICDQWGITPSSTIMVGDHLHDIQSGRRAGAVTILVNNKKNGAYKKESGFNVDSLLDIVKLLQSSPFPVRRSNPEPVAELREAKIDSK